MTKAMVFDMAWTLQGEGDDELPEQVPPLLPPTHITPKS
jgi:hypothetical protein